MVFMLFLDYPMLHAQTLCSTYGGQTPSYVVGVGSSSNITHSSQLGSSLPYGSVVNVVGNFTVNADFTLSGAIVKVNTGAKIFVEANGSYNLVFLILNNTKVFACSGLWKGIELDNFTGITTTNGTQIEDAESAIKSTAGFASLSIDNTIFNRNVIGINLEVPINTWWPPILTYFVNNAFSCTSPLNGTSNGKTEVGVRMKNINYPLVFNYGNSNNTFKGLKNGMYMESDYMVMDLTNYSFLGIEYNCVEFKNGEQLYVQNCEFAYIKRKGILTDNVRNLRVEDSKFTGFNFSENPDVFKNRYMIHVLNPKVNNSNLIQRNEFTTSGSLYNWNFFHLALDVLNASSNEINAHVTTNKFNQLNNFSSFNDLNIGYSTAIYLPGNYSTSSDVDIENNDFIQDANNSGNYPYNLAIDVNNGNKNNVHIVANRYKSGFGRFCDMTGSTGTGNEFTQNISDNGQYGNIGGGLGLVNFKNTKICSNVDNAASVVTYQFIGQNDNTNFTNNITYGVYQSSVWFSNNNPMIGVQENKGNQWHPVSCGGNFVCHPFILHSFPSLVNLSEFTVHTPQSNLNISTGAYSFFSPYFPHFITPNAIQSGFWVTDPNGTPAGDCITQGPNSGGFTDNLIAQNGLSDYLRNPVQQYDAEMYLYRSIKANPNAFNGNRSYNSFLQRNNGKNKDKFTDLETAIDESGKVKDQTKIKVADLRNQAKALELEAKRYNKTNPASVEVIKAWHKKRLDLDNNIDAQYQQHKSEKKIKHQAAKRMLDNTLPLAANERLIKDVYAIYLDAQINNDGKFTVEQTARIKAIAQTCVTEGGMIVYVARGFLSQNDLHDIQGIIDVCEPRSRPESAPRLEAVQTNVTQQKERKVGTATVYPNPAGETFTINLEDNLTATAQITDITGKILKLYSLQTGTNTIRHDLSKGMYIITIKISDGKTLTQKLSINY